MVRHVSNPSRMCLLLCPLVREQGKSYWDSTPENLGGAGNRNSSVDIEAANDGTYHVAFAVPGECLVGSNPIGFHCAIMVRF